MFEIISVSRQFHVLVGVSRVKKVEKHCSIRRQPLVQFTMNDACQQNSFMILPFELPLATIKVTSKRTKLTRPNSANDLFIIV